MGIWEELDARYLQPLSRQDQRAREAQQVLALQQRYQAWTGSVLALVIEDLQVLLRARARDYGWHARFPFRMGAPELVAWNGSDLCRLQLSLWACSVDVYAQRQPHAPPALHFLRQAGGHRCPRMACVPGAWLLRTECGGYELRRFEPEDAPTTLDEMGALAVSLLFGGAIRAA